MENRDAGCYSDQWVLMQSSRCLGQPTGVGSAGVDCLKEPVYGLVSTLVSAPLVSYYWYCYCVEVYTDFYG